MHIEKNICESILGTLLELDGKCKDGEKACLDMRHLGMRKDQHPVPFFLKVDDGESVLWWSSGSSKTTSSIPLVSSSSS
jgi:hypothetical protein